MPANSRWDLIRALKGSIAIKNTPLKVLDSYVTTTILILTFSLFIFHFVFLPFNTFFFAKHYSNSAIYVVRPESIQPF